MFFGGLAIWFLGGSVSLMSRQFQTMTLRPDVWNAQLAFDVLSAFFLMVGGAALISTLAPAIIHKR